MQKIKRIYNKSVRATVCLGLFLAIFLPLAPTQANGDLVAWWKLDEGADTTAIDSSGNGHNGTLTNVTYSDFTPPSVEFDDPYSSFFNQSSSGRIITTPLSLNNYTEFTMAGWAYPTRADSRASWFGQNDLFEFGFTDGDTLFCYTSKGEVSWDFNPVTFLNQWHHITCLATPTQLIVYVDGVNVASTGISAGSFGSSGHNFSIGAGAVDGGNSGPFTGYIDDVRVYSRGLTPDEMDSLGTGSTGPTNGPAVAINSPQNNGATNSWNPSIDWDEADVCEYRFGEGDWQEADCSQAGADIPEPEAGADIELSVRGYFDDVEDPGSSSVAFDYDLSDPTVNAGDNVHDNGVFTQNSSSANDSISGIDSYEWSKQSGPGTVTFSDISVLNPTITAVSLDGTYTLRLTVTDNAGNTAHDDFTLIWDTTSPDIELTDFPDLFSNQNVGSFSFTGSDSLSEPVNYSCKLDEFSFNSCTSPQVYNDLDEGEHTVAIRATDSVGNMETLDGYSWTVDLTAPSITLEGEDNVVVVQGQAYSDAGASAEDLIDGTITDEIIVTNPVNTLSVGTYTVRYNVSDRAGNSANEVIRTVTVVSNKDMNNDGVADAVQENVHGFSSQMTDKSVVLEVDDACTIDEALIRAESVNPEQDMDYDYPEGLFRFRLSCGAPGYTTLVKQYYYNLDINQAVARKYNTTTDKYFSIDEAVINSTEIDGQDVTVVSYEVTDGGKLDMDGQENGVIIDPAGLAVGLEAETDELADTGLDTNIWIAVSLLLSLCGLGIYGLAYKSYKAYR